MDSLLILAVAALVLLALCPVDMRREVLVSLGLRRRDPASTAWAVSKDLTLLLLFAALALLALNPEWRILLLAIDAIGFDVFVLLLALQFRHVLLAGAVGVARCGDGWYRWIHLPVRRLRSRTAREHPLLATYAAVAPILIGLPLALITSRLARHL
jgi:hypothetical protein